MTLLLGYHYSATDSLYCSQIVHHIQRTGNCQWVLWWPVGVTCFVSLLRESIFCCLSYTNICLLYLLNMLILVTYLLVQSLVITCRSAYIYGGFNGVMLGDVLRLHTPDCAVFTSQDTCEMGSNLDYSLCMWTSSQGNLYQPRNYRSQLKNYNSLYRQWCYLELSALHWQ